MNDGLHTPYMNLLGTQMAEEMNQEMIDLGQVGDWQNRERHPRDEFCVITYGVKEGRAFYNKTQTNMELYTELAAAKRMQFALTPAHQRAKGMGISVWGLPEILIDEITLSGIPVREIMKTGDHSDMDKVMCMHYPNLLWVPANWLRSRHTRKPKDISSIRSKDADKPKKD